MGRGVSFYCGYRFRMRFLMPKTIAGQLIALLAVVLIAAQIVNLLLIVGERRIQARTNIFHNVMDKTIHHLTGLPSPLPARLPYTLPPSPGLPGVFFLSHNNRAKDVRKPQLLPKYQRQLEQMIEQKGISVLSVDVVLRPDGPKDRKVNRLANDYKPKKHRHGPRRPPKHHPLMGPDPTGPKAPGMQEIVISIEMQPNIWFNAMVPHYSVEALTPRILLATTILLGLTLLVAWFFTRQISKPLSEFARAADRLGKGDHSVNLKESGPEDMRKAAQAFNIMQRRLSRMLETQRNMLRAVGHDLRTPLTSLRIRAENIPEELGKEKFITTIDDMTLMTEDILSWAKNASGIEDVAAVNLGAMLASLTDDYIDQGKKVVLKDFDTLIVNIRRVAIKRALQNLLNNAIQYGGQACVSVEQTKQYFAIHIDDEGPGIPEQKMEIAIKPFERLEASRNKETGGSGLGLSIVEAFVQADGGRLELKNRQSGGLRASLIFSYL